MNEFAQQDNMMVDMKSLLPDKIKIEPPDIPEDSYEGRNFSAPPGVPESSFEDRKFFVQEQKGKLDLCFSVLEEKHEKDLKSESTIESVQTFENQNIKTECSEHAGGDQNVSTQVHSNEDIKMEKELSNESPRPFDMKYEVDPNICTEIESNTNFKREKELPNQNSQPSDMEMKDTKLELEDSSADSHAVSATEIRDMKMVQAAFPTANTMLHAAVISCVGNIEFAVSENPKLNTENTTSPCTVSQNFVGDSGERRRTEKALFQREGVSVFTCRVLQNNETSKLFVKKAYACPVCDKVFTTNSNRNTHVLIHTGWRAFTCKECNKAFKRRSHLLSHMVVHSREKAKCPICEKLLANSASMKTHMQIHTGDSNYKCNICGKGFIHKCTWKNHLGSHSDERPYSCSECSSSFRLKSKLKRHMLIHSGEKSFRCEECGMCFLQRVQLTAHKRTHSGERPFQCNICDMRFAVSGNLNAHMRTHTGVRPYTCTICNKSFSLSTTLTKHMRVHTDERLYKCTVCSKAFKDNASLKDHAYSHTGERNYVCSVCGRSFVRKRILRKHMMIHDNIKPYECSICGKSFRRSCHLTDHMYVHTGEKPHKCFCGKSFTTKQVYNRHVKSHTEESKCGICKKVLSSSYCLKVHMKLHEEDTVEFGKKEKVK